jgi:tellurite resistance protein
MARAANFHGQASQAETPWLLFDCDLIDTLSLAAQDGRVIVIEDVRKVHEGFISPELRALAVRMDSLEKLSEARHNEVIANFEAMQLSLQLNARLERLEAQRPTASQ